METKLIKLYQKRSFGDKLQDTVDFVRDNWRPLLKYITYLLLPVTLVQTFFMNNFMSGYMSFSTSLGGAKPELESMLPWLSSMWWTMLVQYVGIVLLVALTYTMMQLYEQRPRLTGITWADLQPGVKRMALRQLLLILTGLALCAVAALLIAILIAFGPAMIVLGVMLLLIAMPLFALATPIYLFENTGIVAAYAKSIRLGWKTWGGIVAVTFVLYLLVSIIQGVVSMPGYLMMGIKQALALQGNTTGFATSFGYSAAQYLLGVVSGFVGNCLLVLPFVGLAYQYGHACDKVDGVSVDRDIEQFETLNA